MTIGSKEFQEMQLQFEKDIDKMDIYFGTKAERSKDGMKGYYYDNGKINDAFIAYMFGYQNGRINYMNS